MIVPIALISFGVDFFIHASGRTREMQVMGYSRDRAYPLGLTAVSAALMLAALSSAAAFLSNAVSGIQGIIEFGIAAATGLLLAYMILGWVTPKLLLSVEGRLGPRPADLSHLRLVSQKLGFIVASLIAGIAVTLAIVFPSIGWILFLLFLLLFIYVPYVLTRRRNRRAAEAGRPLTEAVKGAGHGFKAAGSTVHFVARWRVITLPVVGLLAVAALIGASQVERGFELKDFFSSKTDFVISIDKYEQYWGSGGGEVDYVYVEGDLTSPDTLIALETTEAEVAASGGEFTRDINGEVEFYPNAVLVVRQATASAPMRAAIAADTGVEITDADGNGLPDTPEQVAAIYEYVKSNDVVNSDGDVVLTTGQIETFLFVGDGIAGHVGGDGIATFTNDEIILAGRTILEDAAAGLEPLVAGEDLAISVSGGAITIQDSMDKFVQSMLISLPIAVVLTSALVFITLFFIFRHFGRRMASILKRSARYSVDLDGADPARRGAGLRFHVPRRVQDQPDHGHDRGDFDWCRRRLRNPLHGAIHRGIRERAESLPRIAANRGGHRGCAGHLSGDVDDRLPRDGVGTDAHVCDVRCAHRRDDRVLVDRHLAGTAESPAAGHPVSQGR